MADTSLRFLSNINEFTATVNSDGDLLWDSGSIGGLPGRLRVLIDDTTIIYGTKTGLTTSNEFRYNFLLDKGTLSLATSNDFRFYYGIDNGSAQHFLSFSDVSGVLKLAASFYSDSFASENKTNVTLGSASEIEVHCKRSSSNGVSDGFCKVYFAPDYTTPVINITGISCYNVWSSNGGCASLRLGAIASIDAGTNGSFYINRFLLRNTGVQIGSTASSPTVTNISNQSGPFDTPKVVGCTIADNDSDITRCDVSTDDACLIGLTASGSADVQANNSTAPYVTGTHADIVATMGNGITLNRANTGFPTSTASDTITVLVTDSGARTGNDTFDMDWSIDSGQGKRKITITCTLAQFLAGTLTFTPDTDVVGDYTMRMISTTSTPLSDTDDIPVSIINSFSVQAWIAYVARRRRR